MTTFKYKVELPDGSFVRYRSADAFEAWNWLRSIVIQFGNVHIQVATTGQILTDVTELRTLLKTGFMKDGRELIRLRLVKIATSFRLARDMVDKIDSLRLHIQSGEETLDIARDLYHRDNEFRPKQDQYLPAFTTEDRLYLPAHPRS